ncbi:MAG: hypothetical protein JWO42_1041 [Chloroflexi bacterium]|nr:hypothetical protein [Chloroflexota bacterium]
MPTLHFSRVTLLRIVLLLACLILTGPPGALPISHVRAAGTAANPIVMERYHGTLDTTAVQDHGNGVLSVLRDHVEWDLVWTGRFYDFMHTLHLPFRIVKLTGTVSNTWPARYAAMNCTATLGAEPRFNAGLFAGGIFLPDQNHIGLRLVAPRTGGSLLAKGTCVKGTGNMGVGAGYTGPLNLLQPSFDVDLRGGWQSKTFSDTRKSTRNGGAEVDTGSLVSTVTYLGDLCAGGDSGGSNQPGVLGCYVALGDSYSSGEGVEPYQPETSTAFNTCHRSKNAYSQIVARTLGYQPFRAKPGAESEFGACSGAVVEDLDFVNHGAPRTNVDEPAQLKHVQARTVSGVSLVALSFGGNDMGFARIVMDCTITGIYRHAAAVLSKADFATFVGAASNALGKELSASEALAAPCSAREGPIVNRILPGVIARLTRGYREVADAAPRAKVLVVGYPNFFPLTWKADYCLNVITREDAIWTATQIAKFDAAIKDAVASAGRANLIYVAPSAAFATHSICSMTDPWFVQPDILSRPNVWLDAANSNLNDPRKPQSYWSLLGSAFMRTLKTLVEPATTTSLFFHPNAQGQAALASGVLASAG